MNLRKYGQKPYIFAAPLAFLLFFMFLVISAWTNPLWGNESHNMSEMDLNVSMRSLYIFNAGCFIAGALIIVFGMGKWIFEKGLNKQSAPFIMIGGVGMILVGLFTNSYGVWHNVATGILLVSAGIGIVLATVADAKEGDRYVLYIGVIILIALIAQWPFFSGAVSEIMPIIAASFWSLVQLYKYYDNGVLFPVSHPGKRSEEILSASNDYTVQE